MKASSISEYQRARSRYQLSKLEERIQRDADEVLAGADAAREVSSELLALVERGLRELAELVQETGGASPQETLERISTLFVQFTEFADSIRDFYAYLGQVLARYDLTLRDLRGMRPSPPAGTLVRICETPRVVEAAADSACTQSIVCTSSNASTVVLALLDSLAAAGCSFAYHGDFDWPGVALAHRVMRHYDARPWRLGADDYERLAAHVQERRVPSLPLSGAPVATPWDPDLAPTMTAFGIALHEEATLGLLVEDLA